MKTKTASWPHCVRHTAESVLLMQVAFRVDSSSAIGIGHAMRCLTLAIELRKRGNAVCFVSRPQPGDAIERVRSAGFAVAVLPARTTVPPDGVAQSRERWLGATPAEDATGTREALRRAAFAPDWIIADSYGIDAEWEERVRNGARVMAIDDLADRPHACEILLDQTWTDEHLQERYDPFVPPQTRRLLGPAYALLRDEFVDARATLAERDGVLGRIIISFGGADPTGQTLKAYRSIANFSGAIDIVCGSGSPQLGELRAAVAGDERTTLHVDTDSIAALFGRADLALGAAGTSTWERCYLALPSVVLVLAENQQPTAAALARAGALVNLGDAANVREETIAAAVAVFARDAASLRTMGRRALAIMGEGVRTGTQRVADALVDG